MIDMLVDLWPILCIQIICIGIGIIKIEDEKMMKNAGKSQHINPDKSFFLFFIGNIILFLSAICYILIQSSSNIFITSVIILTTLVDIPYGIHCDRKRRIT